MAVNKQEFVAQLAVKMGTTKVQAEKALSDVIQTIKDMTAQKGGVSFVGFGKFEVKERAERKGRNPKTGAEITIPASKTVTFKAGKEFKDLVKG